MLWGGGEGGGVECRWHDKNGVSCERDEYESSLIVGGRGGGASSPGAFPGKILKIHCRTSILNLCLLKNFRFQTWF